MDEENVISNKDDIKYDMKHDIKDVITEQKNTNPWHMTSITDFLYYCCAECNFKDKIEENFIGHATSEHPKSREIFENNRTFDEIPDNKLEENSNDGSTNEDMKSDTGKSLSEALIFASTNPQLDDRWFIELQVQYMKILSSNLGRTCCVQKLFLTFRTIFVHNMFSPCSAKRRASDKDLPVSEDKCQFNEKIRLESTTLVYCVNNRVG